MNDETAQILRRLNQRFYTAEALAFAETRKKPWRGWQRLPQALGDSLSGCSPLRVLDVGCGNGRFAAFLESRWPETVEYLGIDSSATLLEQVDPSPWKRVRARLECRDISEPRWWRSLEPSRFELVLACGLLHHVPGFESRRRLLQELAALLAPGGRLVVTLWCFMNDPRLAGRVLAWPDLAHALGPGFDPEQLEAGDYALAWGAAAGCYRYCHHFDEAEIEALSTVRGLTLQTSYEDDGQSRSLNRYLLFAEP